MPIKDPDKRRQVSKEWREKKMKEGYGRALYARRKQRFENEEILRAAVAEALLLLAQHKANKATKVLTEALEQAPEITQPLDYMPKSKAKTSHVTQKKERKRWVSET